MTFEKDDRVKSEGYGGTWIVRMVDGGEAWCKKEGTGNHLTFDLSILKKLPDFFEAGKTYKSKTDPRLTFDCHYVGHILDDGKYAAGQMNSRTRWASTLTVFSDWFEI